MKNTHTNKEKKKTNKQRDEIYRRCSKKQEEVKHSSCDSRLLSIKSHVFSIKMMMHEILIQRNDCF